MQQYRVQICAVGTLRMASVDEIHVLLVEKESCTATNCKIYTMSTSIDRVYLH